MLAVANAASVLLRADYLAELASRNKVESVESGEGMAFRHSFLFAGNQSALEAALKKQAERDGHTGDSSDSDEDDTGDDIRPELTTGVGFSVRREVDAPRLHPASKQLVRMDPLAIAADHTSLHAHLASHDPVIARTDLVVVEAWLTEMAVKFQRKMEGEQSFNNTTSGATTHAYRPHDPDGAAQSNSEMATDTAGDYQSPLDKMAIGRRILDKAGMPSDLTSRCYIGFFTYTIGFYDCLLGMARHVAQRRQFMATIWRVYLSNLETCEADLYEWVLECVRTENARREDLKRQEHQHRIQLLRQHVKHLKKKVQIMQLNDSALQTLSHTEQTSIRNLGTNLREMQHVFEMGVEHKSNIHTNIAEWTMNSFEMESSVHGATGWHCCSACHQERPQQGAQDAISPCAGAEPRHRRGSQQETAVARAA